MARLDPAQCNCWKINFDLELNLLMSLFWTCIVSGWSKLNPISSWAKKTAFTALIVIWKGDQKRSQSPVDMLEDRDTYWPPKVCSKGRQGSSQTSGYLLPTFLWKEFFLQIFYESFFPSCLSPLLLCLSPPSFLFWFQITTCHFPDFSEWPVPTASSMYCAQHVSSTLCITEQHASQRA